MSVPPRLEAGRMPESEAPNEQQGGPPNQLPPQINSSLSREEFLAGMMREHTRVLEILAREHTRVLEILARATEQHGHNIRLTIENYLFPNRPVRPSPCLLPMQKNWGPCPAVQKAVKLPQSGAGAWPHATAAVPLHFSVMKRNSACSGSACS